MSEKAAMLGAGEAISYREMIQRINGSARLLAGFSGRILLIGENSPGWIYGFYGALARKLIAVPVDAMASASDIRYIIDDCQPSAILCSTERLTTIAEAVAGLPQAPAIIGFETLEKQDVDQESTDFQAQAETDQTAVLIYTSGTTGSPKGVMLSYGNLVTNMEGVSTGRNRVYNHDDRIMMLLPVHHIFPLLGTLMISLYVGATIVLCPSMSGEAIIRTLKDHQVSIIIGVPRLYSMIRSGIRTKLEASKLVMFLFGLAGRLHNATFSRLVFGSVHRKFGGHIRFMVSGGAALDELVARDYLALGFDLLEGYGMTEAAPMITFTRPGTLHPGSPGQVLEGVEVEIRDGEIVARGPNIMQGYWQRPEETAAILKDGWLHTGDLGEFDAEGYLHITGRRKEIIVLSNGKNINPAEIESGLEAMNPAVKEAAIYQDGDRLRAILVLARDRLPAEIKNGVETDAWVREHVIKAWNMESASYKTLAGFVISEAELPRTRLGKLRRFQLASLAEGSVLAQRDEPPQKDQPAIEEFGILRDYLEHEKKIKVHATDHLVMDIGMDSLDSIGFQAFVESSFGIQLPLEQLASFDSIGALALHVAQAKTISNGEGLDWSKMIKQGLAQAKGFKFRFPRTWITSPIFSFLSRAFFHFYFNFRGRGLANIPDQPCIIVPNHQSFFDGMFVASLLKFRQLKNTFFYAKSKHVKGGFMSAIAKHNNVIVMDINKNLKESIIKVAEVLKSQRSMIIFPEGTRTKDGSLGDFKRMFAILSRELNVPVVPVSIRGAFEALPRGARFPKPFRSVSVEFLPPVYPENLDYDSLTAKVRAAIAAAMGPKLQTS